MSMELGIGKALAPKAFIKVDYKHIQSEGEMRVEILQNGDSINVSSSP